MNPQTTSEPKPGTPITSRQPENLRIVQPIRQIDGRQAVGLVETADGKLRVRIRPVMGDGPVAAVEFMLTNVGDGPLTDVRLSAYANLEAAHSHENDYSTLDSHTGGLLVVDPPSGMCLVMAGLDRPARGYSGTWASQGQLQAATGIDAKTWPKFAAIPEDARRRLARAPRPGVAHAPGGSSEPAEPETRAGPP